MEQILVVDDEAFLRWNAERLLTDAGYRVLLAEDGQKALEAYEQAGAGAIALVILDYRMPVMDGIEAFERLRAIDPKARILINSASLETARLHDLLDAGAVGSISKPYTKQEYLTAVRAALK
jgi:CheY-like chemotaxis protein